MIRVDRRGRIRREAVEYPLVDHCNLACDGCDHGSPFLPEQYRSLEQFSRDIAALEQALSVKALKFVGGEPLLHKQLGDFIEIASSSSLADTIEIWTNGLLLHKLDDRIFEMIDVLRITTYPGIELRFDRSKLKDLSKRHKFHLLIEHRAKFLQCFPTNKIDDAASVQKIFDECENSHVWSCHSFLDGYYYKCSRAEYIRKQLALDGFQTEEFAGDGVSLERPDLRTALESYLVASVPLAACQWCLGTSGPAFGHRQLPRDKRNRSELVNIQRDGRKLG